MNKIPGPRGQETSCEADLTTSVPWHPSYRLGVLDLLSDVPYKAALWNWEFETNPFDKQFSPVLILDQSGKVVGFNGVLPIEATENGRLIDALWSCDFYVSEALRGQGLGSVIKAELHRKASIIMAFGISEQASRVLQHLGWRPHGAVYNYRLLRRRRSWRDWAFSLLQCLNRSRALMKSKDAESLIKVTSALPSERAVNELWEREEAYYPRVVRRHYQYLDWKYQKHPLARYAFVEAWQRDQLLALLVVRYHGDTLRIVDYSGPAENSRLKRALLRHTRRHWQHAQQITATTSDPEFGQCLRDEGFFRPRTRPKFYVYEHDAEERSAGNNWFIMAGDSDGELLAAAADFCGGDRPEISKEALERDDL